MSDEYDEYPTLNSRLPDMSSALAQRITAKQGTMAGVNPPPGTVDPYKLMLQRKNNTEASDIDPGKIVRWPEADVQKLQDYCMKMGIYGFNSGRMHPLVALSQLKKQFGDDYTDVPLEQRVPEGYEKKGTLSGYGPNYPYSQAMKQKQIIHG
jgi:hypothetical protein